MLWTSLGLNQGPPDYECYKSGIWDAKLHEKP